MKLTLRMESENGEVYVVEDNITPHMFMYRKPEELIRESLDLIYNKIVNYKFKPQPTLQTKGGEKQ